MTFGWCLSMSWESTRACPGNELKELGGESPARLRTSVVPVSVPCHQDMFFLSGSDHFELGLLV